MRDLTRQKKRRSAFDRVVEMALRHLAVDVVHVAELRDGSRQYRAAAGDAASFNIIVNGVGRSSPRTRCASSAAKLPT
jgi:hypothetical protein